MDKKKMKKTPEEYLIAILLVKLDEESDVYKEKYRYFKYVTSVGDHHTAYWEDGKEAMSFSKERAIDMCKGFAWNGITAMPILKQDYLTYVNPKKDDEGA